MYTASSERYDTMVYNRCGKSGLLLPAVSLGLWHNFGTNADPENMKAMLRTAFDLGITHFDLANNYGPEYGSAETNFGKILKEDFAPYRDEMIISTKAGYDMWPGPYGNCGRNYCHINANGDVEPCVFIHYSSANIREVTLLEALKQPLFMAYRDRQPFNSNHLRPCPMLENPEILQEMIKETGAKSTDLQSPESAEHLCSKCKAYACEWKKTADQLWKEHPHQQKGYTNYKKRVEKQ